MLKGTLIHQGRERTFHIVEPSGPQTDALIFFHGSQQSGRVVRKFSNETFDSLPFLVVYPDGVEQHWNDARLGLDERTRHLAIDDVGFFISLIRHLGTTYGTQRVFVAGYSNGGQMVMRLIHEVPKMLSGAATIAANMPAPHNTLPELRNYRAFPVPYMSIAGTADPFSPFSGGDAGIGHAHRRGDGLSAFDSATYFAARNGISTPPARTTLDDTTTCHRWNGKDPVEFLALDGIGHIIPSGKTYPAFLGPSTTALIAAEEIGRFFAEVGRS